LNNVADHHLKKLTELAPRLQIIELNGLDKFNDGTFKTILYELKALELVQINQTPGIT